MPSAFILGGTGQIGRAVAEVLYDRGWSITLACRTAPSADLADGRLGRIVVLDRHEPGSLQKALGDGADLLLDTIPFDAADARQLLGVQGAVGQILAVSSASVYRDAEGRTLDEARVTGFPQMPDPICESQPTVDPGPATYSTRKVAMEQLLLQGIRGSAAIIRPCAIHGPNSRHPREWWFVKRLLDGRTHIPLAYAGRSCFQTSATINIAGLVAQIAETRSSGIFNAVDPDSPDVAEIGAAIMTALGRTAVLVPVADEGYPPRIGATPWSVPRPFRVAAPAADAIGYRPVAHYAEAVSATVARLAAADVCGWELRFPALAAYPWNLFDYSREDAWLASP